MWAASLVEILRSLHATLVAQFWPCWLALTAAVVTSSAWPSPGRRSRGARGTKEASSLFDDAAGRPPPSWPSVLSAFLVCYIALMLVWQDFAYYDNDFL